MANIVSALKWINENHSRHSIKVREFTWPFQLGLPIFDYEISMTLEGIQYKGRGQSSNETEAIVKALAECIERLHCGWHQLHTSGVAAHFTNDDAKLNAVRELHEHDSVFCHLLTGRLPSATSVPQKISELTGSFSNKDLSFEFYKEPGAGLAVTFAVRANTVVSLGLGYGPNALVRSAAECLPNAANFVFNKGQSLVHITEWRKMALTSPPLEIRPVTSKFNITFLKSPFVTPFYVVRAAGNGFQKYLTEGWCIKDIHEERLRLLGLTPIFTPVGKKLF